MPNIIEQQDLLKGLPDARLATLMQNPVGDIPPFLVAAEAQRRQAIRQQFAGSGQNESVVDTLTKQMANVPQNVQAPMQAPPQLPPPQMQPQMAPQGGIAAIPQQAPQMAGGGMVRRYQVGGKVEPMWRVPNILPTLTDIGGWIGDKASNAYTAITTPYSEMAPSVPDIEETVAPSDGYVDPFVAAKRPAIRGTKPVIPPNPNAGKADTSTENKTAAEDSFRKRLEDLYRTEEPSNWEEAQKWFAMSAQIMNPDANLLQGLVNAGNVYAQAEAAQAMDRRAGQRDLAEAMLKYDMAQYEDQQARESAGLKARTDIATGQLDDLYRQQSDIADQIRRIDDSIMKGEYTDPEAAAAQKTALQTRYNSVGTKIAAYESYIGSTYGFPTIPTVDIASGTVR